ncbi:MAG: PRTRC system protein A [Pseudomonadota bacterium]
MPDPRDTALLSSCPTLAAPRFGTLPDMGNGQRVIVAANGVFLQVRLDWLDCTLCIARLNSAPPLPYGLMQEHIAFAFGVIPVALLREFVEAGRDGLPNEIAGGLIYTRKTGRLRLQVYEALQASANGIDYRMPPLAQDETLAVDLHTHGRVAAFWSATDDRDDLGIKVAGVFGHLDRARPSAAFRLVANGHYLALRHPWLPADVQVTSGSALAGGARGAILRWLQRLRGE